MQTTIRLEDKFAVDVRDYCESKGFTFTGLVKVLLKEKMERDPVGKK